MTAHGMPIYEFLIKDGPPFLFVLYTELGHAFPTLNKDHKDELFRTQDKLHIHNGNGLRCVTFILNVEFDGISS